MRAGSCDHLEALREADAIVREGKRAYDWPCIIRCINTVDVMTAEVPELDWALLKRITAEVPGICRVCYDLTPKPVGTVEWGIAGTGFCTRFFSAAEYRLVLFRRRRWAKPPATLRFEQRSDKRAIE